MRPSLRVLAWVAYVVAALLLLEVAAGPWYFVLVAGAGLALAWVVPPPVPPRSYLVAHDLVRLGVTYAACVGLFYLAFQVFTVDNVAGLFFAFAAALLLGVIAPLMHVVVAQRRPIADLGITGRQLPATLAIALLFAVVQSALTLPKVAFGPPESWIPLLGMALAVGFFEAVFFRAYVIAVLEPMVGTIGAVVSSAGLYALYHVGYGMAPVEMLFLFGLGIVYVVAYLLTRNVLVIWPLLTPLGGFFNNVTAGDIEMPLIAVLGFVNILGLMLAAVFLVRRWQRRHPGTATPGVLVS